MRLVDLVNVGVNFGFQPLLFQPVAQVRDHGSFQRSVQAVKSLFARYGLELDDTFIVCVQFQGVFIPDVIVYAGEQFALLGEILINAHHLEWKWLIFIGIDNIHLFAFGLLGLEVVQGNALGND